MMRRQHYAAVLLAAGWLCSTATMTAGQDRLWRPYLEFEARGTSDRWINQGNVMVPLSQDSNSLIFADIRGRHIDDGAAEGNFGLAFRTMLDSDLIFGAYAFYDLRQSGYGNTFHQGSVGLELLGVDWGLRWNGYVPDQGRQSAAGASSAFLEDGTIVVRSGLEAAYWGTDLEGELLLWSGAGELDPQLWVSAGLFHFDNAARDFDSMAGPRVRAELRLFDLPCLGRDSRLVFSGQYEYDQLRHSVGSGLVNVRIPFGPGGGSTGRRLQGLDRRMVAPIVRDIDIVTNAGAFGRTEAAKIARTGRLISGAVVIDANTPDPAAVVAGAGVNSVVIVDGSAGTIATEYALAMNNGQVLIGGQSGLAVFGCETGSRALFRAPGMRPLIDGISELNNVIALTDNTTFLGIDVKGGVNGISTNGADVSNVYVIDSSASYAIDDGFDFSSFTGLIQNNRAFGNGEDGFDFEGNMNGLVLNNVSTENWSDGFDFADIGVNGVVSHNMAADNLEDGFNLSNVQGRLENNLALNNANRGFLLNDITPGGLVAGNVARGNAVHGFLMGDVAGEFHDNIAEQNGGHGFLFDHVQTDGLVAGNRAHGNAAEGFIFGNIAGAFHDNIAEQNDGFGFVFGDVNPDGLMAGNMALGNSGSGYIFGDVSGIFNHNVAEQNGGFGFDFRDVNPGGLIAGNLARGNGAIGYDFGNVAGAFSDNVAEQNGAHGFVFGDIAPGGQVARNMARGNVGHGYFFGDVAGALTDNVAEQNGIYGFTFGNVASGGLVSGNMARGNVEIGYLFGDVAGSITDNVAEQNGGIGFRSFNLLTGGLVAGNLARGNGSTGFRLARISAGSVVRDNFSEQNDLHGFLFNNLQGLVEGNIARGNATNGIDFQNVEGGTLSNNLAEGNGRHGLNFDLIRSDGRVLGNTAAFNTESGFKFDQNIGEFSDNTSNDNGNLGYEPAGPNNGAAMNNTGTGNANGGDVYP